LSRNDKLSHVSEQLIMPYVLTPTPSKQSGIILPLTAIMLVGLLAVTGLALDTGEVFEDYGRAQTAADAAALAGAFEKFNGRDSTIITAPRIIFGIGRSKNKFKKWNQ